MEPLLANTCTDSETENDFRGDSCDLILFHVGLNNYDGWSASETDIDIRDTTTKVANKLVTDKEIQSDDCDIIADDIYDLIKKFENNQHLKEVPGFHTDK